MRAWKVALCLSAISACLVHGAGAEEEANTMSALDQRLAESKMGRNSSWFIEPHRPSYILPLTYVEDPSRKLEEELAQQSDQLDEVEVKFQFSFRLNAAEDLVSGNGDLFFAYTQVSVWQAYNSENSSPFRDTNYEPEMFMSFDTDYEAAGLDGKLLTFGAVHQSNGRGNEDLSRSWNRIYANAVLERGNFVLSIKPWWRIPEDEEEDNNPDIADFYGYGEVRAAYKLKEHTLSTMIRNNGQTTDNYGAVELNWSFPLQKQLRGYVQYFYGYGETLLDYNERDERIGIGFMLADWI